ncbi:MAG: diadenylate cyclase CdaA [bacterium]|jgi:diadenylate cyclase|nr:diadenylate cyclase CdaA [Spirochaetales bacterium]MDT3390326.1 diadenylate cyclase CdaA [bacterium]
MPVTTVDWIRVVVQILMLTFFFYNFYIALAQNRATQMIRSILVYAFLYIVCKFTGLKVMEDLLRICAVPAAVALLSIYGPELRRTFTPGASRRTRLFRIGGTQASSDQIETILSACQRLVQSKRGALIVFPRKLALKNIIDSGTKMNADISSALIVTVFDHDTPLHDGAMIIQGSKIIAAGCYLPLSGQTDIRASFGTRHRAALGMAEESDAAIIVVSEETGAISLACNGNLYYDLSHDEIMSMLLSLFNYADVQPASIEEGRNDAQ